jgi:hypothetical protein
MGKYHYGDKLTLTGKVVRVWEDTNRTNVMVELDTPDGAQQVVSFACCETALPVVSVTPMSADEIANRDAEDAAAQAAEKLLASKQGRTPTLLPTWRERVDSL